MLQKLKLKRLVNWALYLVVGAIGSLNVFSPTILSGFQKMQQDTGDPLFNAFVLEHIYKYFFDSTYTASLLSPRFFYPAPNLLTFSDNLLGSAPIYWFFRQFFDWSLSFQLWEIIVLVLTYVGFIWLFRYLKVRPSLSALAAFIITFGMPRVMQVIHPQIFPQFFTPFAFIFLFKFLKKPKLKDFNLFVLFVFLQGVAGYYLGWFLVFSLCLLFLVLPIFLKEHVRQVFVIVSENSKRFFISTVLWASAFLVFWFPYILTSYYYRDLRVWDYIGDYMGGIFSWVYVPKTSFWAPVFLWVPEITVATWEQYVFPGMFVFFLIFLLVLFFLIKSKLGKLFERIGSLFNFADNADNKDAAFKVGIIQALFVVFLLISLVSLKIGNFTLWKYIYLTFPGADGMRFVARIWVVSYVYLLISGFLLIENILGNFRKSRLAALLLVAVFVFAISEQLVFEKKYFYKRRVLQEIDSLSQTIEQQHCDISYLETGEGRPIFVEQHIFTMFAGIQTNTAVINGYTGTPTFEIDKKLDRQAVQEYLARYDYNYGDEIVCLISKRGDFEYFVKDTFRQVD